MAHWSPGRAKLWPRQWRTERTSPADDEQVRPGPVRISPPRFPGGGDKHDTLAMEGRASCAEGGDGESSNVLICWWRGAQASRLAR